MKKIIKIFVLLIIICVLVVAAYIGVLQSRFLSERYFDKTLVSIEINEYAEEPFISELKRTVIIDDAKLLDEIQLKLNEQNLGFGLKESTSVILKFNYKDGSSLISFLYKDYIGFDYGNICLKIRNVEEIFQ